MATIGISVEYGDSPLLSVPSEIRPQVYGWVNKNDRGYTINEIPSGTKRHLRVIAVGAGASGINFAKFCQDKLENVEVTIFEKNADVGGTWTENRYPGCACDIPSVTYQYTWEPNNWSKYYSEAPEILQYFQRIVKKYELGKYIRLKHCVEEARWDEESGVWTVAVRDLETKELSSHQCEVFINATGILNNWRWPDVRGLKDFQGTLCHTATFPEDLKLEGKRVAVIGTGSSGIQIIAKIQPVVSRLYTWVRTPTWMTPGFAQSHAGPNGENIECLDSAEIRRRFDEDPDWYLKYRKVIDAELGELSLIHKNSSTSKNALKYATEEMRRKLAGYDDLAESLIPKDFPVGCKRPTPGNGYLEALISDNVQVYMGTGLSEMTPRGFLDPQGNEVSVDVIICASGFDTSWVPRFPIVANGRNLQDIYRARALGYLGVAAPHMPNYFTFYGPYSPLGQGSVLPTIEYFSNYIIQVIQKMQVQNIKSLAPKLQAIEDYGEHADLWLKRTVWDAPCRSWLKGGTTDGKVMLYCGTRTQFLELITTPFYEDYDITYRNRNRWAWLGNGFSQRDVNGKDLTWYMGLVDGQDEQKLFDV